MKNELQSILQCRRCSYCTETPEGRIVHIQTTHSPTPYNEEH